MSARLARAAAGQHALVTLEQMTALDITRNQRARMLTSGQIVRVGPHVHLQNGAPFTWQTRIAAARLGAGADALVSHRSAAALHGLDGFDHPRVVHLTVRADRRPKGRRDVQTHRCSDYELIEPHVRQNIVVTDPARTVLDLYAGERNPDVARRGLFSARKRNLVTSTELERCARTTCRHGRPGIRRLHGPAGVVRRIRRALVSRGGLLDA